MRMVHFAYMPSPNGRHRPRSRQSAVTVCPLRACSETSFRHFALAFFVLLVMSQHCRATQSSQDGVRLALTTKPGRVGSCISLFEVCSAFTHVTAYTLAESPKRPCAYRELPPYHPASLWHANRRSSRCTFLVGKHIGV